MIYIAVKTNGPGKHGYRIVAYRKIFKFIKLEIGEFIDEVALMDFLKVHARLHGTTYNDKLRIPSR